MKRGLAAALMAIASCVVAIAAQAQMRVTDATGREVTLPARIERIYAAGPPASVLLLALAPRKLIAWTRAPRADEAAYLPESLISLPELGRLTGRGNTANIEVVMRAKPDLIVDIGSTSATFVTLAERVQEQTGIPYLLFDGTLSDTPRLLREVGRAIGERDAAETRARDAEGLLRDVAARVSGIAERDRPRVYFARGPNGLTTAPRGSMQAEVIVLAGGVNPIAPPPAFTGNLINVSIEDVLLAKPDVIVASDPAFARAVGTMPAWRDVPAVRDGRVYEVPDLPFGWFDSAARTQSSARRAMARARAPSQGISRAPGPGDQVVSRALLSSRADRRPGPRAAGYGTRLPMMRAETLAAPIGSSSHRTWIVMAAALAALIALALLALGSGRYPLSIGEVAGALWNRMAGREERGMADAVVWQIRMPRVGVAMLVGAALAAAGTAYQHLFRNPLVAPDTLGVSSGAALGAVLRHLRRCGLPCDRGAALHRRTRRGRRGDVHRVATLRSRSARHADPDRRRRREPARRCHLAA